jgi:hypothetical protein
VHCQWLIDNGLYVKQMAENMEQRNDKEMTTQQHSRLMAQNPAEVTRRRPAQTAEATRKRAMEPTV